MLNIESIIFAFLIIFAVAFIVFKFISFIVQENKISKLRNNLLERISIFIDTKIALDYDAIEHPGKISFLKSGIVREFTYFLPGNDLTLNFDSEVKSYFTDEELEIVKDLILSYSKEYRKISRERCQKDLKKRHIDARNMFDKKIN